MYNNLIILRLPSNHKNCPSGEAPIGLSGQKNGLTLRGGYGFTEKKYILRKLLKLFTDNNVCNYCNKNNY